MRCVGGLFCALWLLASPAVAADARDALNRARTFYNQGKFDQAIAAADEARHAPELADSADLIAARALLERYRAGNETVESDLSDARRRFSRIDPSRFNGGERTELIVGLGETLYLDDAKGAAAEVFESVLTPGGPLPSDERERILDWWASALDRDAKPRPEIDQRMIYQRIRERMRKELVLNPASSTASYWIAAAARGEGDLQAAWDAARAGWVRGSLSRDHGVRLREDLERLMQVAIIPERSRVLAVPPESIGDEWTAFKEKWR